MRNLRLSLLSVVSVATLSVSLQSTANAQAYKVEPEKPKFDDLPSPDFNVSKTKAFKPKDWLEIEASFKVQMSPEPPSKTAERVTVKWFIAVEHPDKKGAFLLLTKDITHVNVPLGEEIFSSVYLSPASIKRLTGRDRAGKSVVNLVGYEILINGEKVAQETSDSKVGWWNTTSDKISRSDSVPLLNKSETPFASMWWDRYAEILVEKR
jgi:hypothetical protein